MSYSLGAWQAMLATMYLADKVQLGEFDFAPTSRLAKDLDIPAPSLARLLRSLHRAGVIETREGVRGGFRHAVPPAEVTLLAVVDDTFDAACLCSVLFLLDDSKPLVDEALRVLKPDRELMVLTPSGVGDPPAAVAALAAGSDGRLRNAMVHVWDRTSGSKVDR